MPSRNGPTLTEEVRKTWRISDYLRRASAATLGLTRGRVSFVLGSVSLEVCLLCYRGRHAYLTRIDVDMGSLDVAWQKSFRENNSVDPVEGSGVVALSAFLLSSLPTPIDRKVLIKEMWESGAEVIVRALVAGEPH